MIQLNLLPDVKLEYIKARQKKRLVVSVASVASIAFLAIMLLLLFYVKVVQNEHLNNLNKDITAKTKELKEKPDLEKILTIQNQLNSLPGLHDNKVISSRLFDYLTQLTPSEATISDVTIDFGGSASSGNAAAASNTTTGATGSEGAQTLNIKGNTDSLTVVNKFVDTIKFTGFVVNNADDESGQTSCGFGNIEQQAPNPDGKTICRAFSQVVLKSFELNASIASGEKPVAYEISFMYDPLLFKYLQAPNDQQPIELRIPNIVSTRSVTEKPSKLFEKQPEAKEEEGQ